MTGHDYIARLTPSRPPARLKRRKHFVIILPVRQLCLTILVAMVDDKSHSTGCVRESGRKLAVIGVATNSVHAPRQHPLRFASSASNEEASRALSLLSCQLPHPPHEGYVLPWPQRALRRGSRREIHAYLRREQYIVHGADSTCTATLRAVAAGAASGVRWWQARVLTCGGSKNGNRRVWDRRIWRMTLA